MTQKIANRKSQSQIADRLHVSLGLHGWKSFQMEEQTSEDMMKQLANRILYVNIYDNCRIFLWGKFYLHTKNSQTNTWTLTY